MHRPLSSLLTLIVVVPSVARADFFTSTPGPLVRAHAASDDRDRCQDCHVGSRELSREKCLACHAPIAERQAQSKGVHGSGKALGRPCQLCHSDHQGRNADIFGWKTFGGQSQFDHAITGFALDGKHKTTACLSCHTQKTKTGTVTFLDTRRSCASCHKNPHGDTREPIRRCERCHDASSWKSIDRPEFDHQTDTRYPLLAKHEHVRCGKCHAARSGPRLEPVPPNAKASLPEASPEKLIFRWRGFSTDCTPCHDNVHGASLFGQKKCSSCHSAKVAFASIAFDHDRHTRFRLDGAHDDPKKATCYSCHKKDERTRPDMRCESCHKDVHANRFQSQNQNDCSYCHTTKSFKSEVLFQHATRTRFRLDGAHAEAACRKCHRGASPVEWERFDSLIEKAPNGGIKIACMGCHQHANVHERQYNNDQCLNCHKSGGIRENKSRAVNDFHGPRSRFPLADGHKAVKCVQCHPNNVFKNAPLVCGPACHADELHKGTLGPDCLKCHEGATWTARRFDHDKMTRWPLVGHHREVRCEECHKKRDFVSNRGKEVTCASCHSQDDVHKGQLGTRCEKCHNPDGVVRFDHNDPKLSSWPIKGKHEGVACAACHTSIQFKPAPRACEGCHPEPAVHRGQLGIRCGNCHVWTDWKTIHTGHDIPSPRFGGAHDRVPCARCHVGGRALAGTSPLCITCHRPDDIHHNTLGPRCADCHSQRSFAGARFEHSRVGCELTGVHRLQPCVACHVGGNFTSLAPNCIACHAADARRATAVSMTPEGMMRSVPPHDGFSTCAGCHNPNFFVPRQRGNARESVCR